MARDETATRRVPPKRSSLSLRRAKTKAASRRLGAVHGGIRRLDQRVRVPGVCRIERDADAGPDIDALLLTAELERRRKRSNDFPGDGFGVLAPGDVGQDQGEFIAPDAGHRVGFAYLVPDPRGNGLQEFVAGGVPQGVVHRLELVQVEVQQRELARAAFGKTDRLTEPVVEQQPVRQAGEAVVMRNTLDALFHQLVFGNVGRHRKTAQGLPTLPDMRQKLDLEVAGLAVCKLARPMVSHRMSLQHLRKMAFDLPVRLLPDHLLQVLAENVLDGKTEKLGKYLVSEAATQVLIPRDGHGRNVVDKQAQLRCAFAQGFFRLLARSDVGYHRDDPVYVPGGIAQRTEKCIDVDRAAVTPATPRLMFDE